MRKIIIAVAFFLLTFFGLGLTRIEVEATGCTDWICEFTQDEAGGTYQTCDGIPAGCDDDLPSDFYCPPGYYTCNRGCCAIGAGGGGGGNRGVSCTSNYKQNCPAGTTRSNLATSTGCYPNPQIGVCGVGNAQTVGGCCEEGENKDGEIICKQGSVITYLCCPPNSAATSTMVSGGTYTTAPSCSSAACNDGDDLYIGSTGAPQSDENKCGWDCSFWDGEGDDQRCRSWNRIWRYKTITTCQERHLEYSCEPTCDANAWGAWGACSASCGGGIQTRTNACGSTQGQVCNTQSCQGPWWQVKDGDITTNGDIVSRMPAGYYLDTVGSGGFPGVPVYGGSIGTAPGTISQTLWNANTTTVQSRIFNYSYFENLVPEDIVFNDSSIPARSLI